VNWNIDHSSLPQFIRVTSTGTPSIEDYIARWEDVFASQYWQPGTNILFDDRALESLGPDGYDLMSQASKYFRTKEDLIGEAWISVLVNEAENPQFGYQFGYSIADSPQQLVFFFEESKALEWVSS
jgi:hypothetical protein